jgi:hypothetical protein
MCSREIACCRTCTGLRIQDIQQREERYMKKFCAAGVVVTLLAITFSAQVMAADEVPPKTHPDTKNWEDLFTADLSNADFPKGIWSVKDGEMTATDDKNIFTQKQYENFILDLEFKTADHTNSGVVVHCSDVKNWIPNSIEIQIQDDFKDRENKSPKNTQCGGVFGHIAPSKITVKAPGEWNRFTITCVGSMVYIMLNGESVCEMDMTKWTDAKKNPDGSDIPPWLSKAVATLPLKGHIGFQGKHAGAPIFFRNLKIKELPAK